MKKVLFILHDASRSGAPIVLLNYLRWFKKNTDIQFEVLLAKGGPLVSEYNDLAPTFIFDINRRPTFFMRKLKYMLALINLGSIYDKLNRHFQFKLLKEQFKNEDFGLIYSNTATNSWVLKQLDWLSCPIITHIHELEYVLELFGEENSNHLISKTGTFIACSNAVRENLIHRYGISDIKVNVIHEFIPIDNNRNKITKHNLITKQLNLPDDAFLIGSSGSLEWRKGSDLFAQLAKLVIKKYSKSVYFIWLGGDQNSRQYLEFVYDVNKLGMNEQVHIISSKPNPLDYIECFDIFILLSREDPYPLVCLEAASLGIPILCFDNAGGMPEFVEQDCGYVIDYLDLDMMANKIIELHSSRNILIEMGENAARKVRERHLLEDNALKITDIIVKSLNSSSPSI